MKSGGLGHIILLAGRRESSEERERARESERAEYYFLKLDLTQSKNSTSYRR